MRQGDGDIDWHRAYVKLKMRFDETTKMLEEQSKKNTVTCCCKSDSELLKGYNKYLEDYIDTQHLYDGIEDEYLKAINYTRCSETLKDKYDIVFEDWLKDHKFNQDNNGFNKNGTNYKVNEITWMHIQDVYDL